jgi:hypothetical protein
MCLKSVTRKVPPAERGKVVVGWKVFQVVEGIGNLQFCGQYFGIDYYPVGRWIERGFKGDLRDEHDTPYKAGFHAFLTKKAADDYLAGSHYGDERLQTARVKLRGIRTEGIQVNNWPDDPNLPCVVADEMLIVDKPKRGKR